MKKQMYHYAISGYRYAPESFHVAKGLDGQSLKVISLTDDQRSQIGYLYLMQGYKAAVDQVKRIERERGRNLSLYITYGFRTQNGGYLYFPQLYCRPKAPLSERLDLFRLAREEMKRCGCEMLLSESCELDGNYRPTNVKQHYVVADLNRPLTVWLKLNRKD